MSWLALNNYSTNNLNNYSTNNLNNYSTNNLNNYSTNLIIRGQLRGQLTSLFRFQANGRGLYGLQSGLQRGQTSLLGSLGHFDSLHFLLHQPQIGSHFIVDVLILGAFGLCSLHFTDQQVDLRFHGCTRMKVKEQQGTAIRLK